MLNAEKRENGLSAEKKEVISITLLKMLRLEDSASYRDMMRMDFATFKQSVLPVSLVAVETPTTWTPCCLRSRLSPLYQIQQLLTAKLSCNSLVRARLERKLPTTIMENI